MKKEGCEDCDENNIQMDLLHLAMRISEMNLMNKMSLLHLKAERGEEVVIPTISVEDLVSQAKVLYQFVKQQ